MTELPKELYPCPRWQVHDDDPVDSVCPVCNGRGVVLPNGLPVPENIIVWVDKFEPVNVVEGELPTVEITFLPKEENAVDVKCPHCQKVNKVAGFVPRDPDKPNSQGREVDVIICGFCGQRFTPPNNEGEQP